MAKRKKGKIYTFYLEGEGNTPLRFLGGDESNGSNYARLGTAERVFEETRGTGFNLENLPSLRDLMGEDEQLSPNSNLWLAMGQAGGEEKLKQVVCKTLSSKTTKMAGQSSALPILMVHALAPTSTNPVFRPRTLHGF